MGRLTDERELYEIGPDGKTILRVGVVVISDKRFAELLFQMRLTNNTLGMLLEEQRKTNLYMEHMTDLGIFSDEIIRRT